MLLMTSAELFTSSGMGCLDTNDNVHTRRQKKYISVVKYERILMVDLDGARFADHVCKGEPDIRAFP